MSNLKLSKIQNWKSKIGMVSAECAGQSGSGSLNNLDFGLPIFD
jgi:hypothetical protein